MIGQLEQSKFVLVPRIPTEEMLKAAWADAHDESAIGVWESMLEAWESSVKDGKFENGQ